MRNHFRALAALATTFCVIGQCDGYTTFYGPSGQLAGSANSIGGYTTYYNAQGGLAGSSNSVGNMTNFYNSEGGLAGSANSVTPYGMEE